MNLFHKTYRLARTFGYRLGLQMAQDDPFRGHISQIPEDEKTSTDMHRAFYDNPGNAANKWRNYLGIYDRHFNKFKGRSVRLLEIGVSGGGSLEVWRRYFGEKAVIFGIDINPACSRYDGLAASVRIGSQTDTAFLKGVADEMGGIDIVIDDGSHIASHQRISFETLFPLLDQNGVYLCEDTHTAYWRGEFEGGYRKPSNFIEVSKCLVDDIHSHFHRSQSGLKDANKTIYGLHFYSGIVVIEKEPQPQPLHISSPPA